ncbi:neurotrophin 1 [Ooceraea biroi]|uniref:Protein spaetzle n=1 Tax=Ooceraea biroi TaxID=2015173 RepID=A0A026WTA2_OOCBI|nr:neurotrophin 1 [Ooceraea biroi]EZA59173.1 Protein spaetzle [Ooceraea biroi]
MMVLRKYTIVFMLEVFVILPIIVGARLYHDYDSYQEYYDNHIYDINSEQLKPIPEEIAEESFYNPNNDAKKQINSRFTGIPSRVSKYTKLENNFAFPDEQSQAQTGEDRNSNRKIVLSPVAKCNDKNQTFCEDVPNYPTEFVNWALSKNSSLMHYAHRDVIAIVQRADTAEETLCLSTEQLIRPKAGINIENKWLYILQSNETGFHQNIRVETCQEANSKCRLIDGFAEGYVTTCKQKYIYRELSAISEDGEVVRDYFRFPASCCCHVQFQVTGDDTE